MERKDQLRAGEHLASLDRDERIVGALEAVDRLTTKMVDKLHQLQGEQAELRDEVHALSNRIEAVARYRPTVTHAFCHTCGSVQRFTEGKCDVCAAPIGAV